MASSSLVNNKYRITRRIGGGSFGEIYMGVGPNGEKVAVKFERHGTRCPQLRHEYKVYRELTNCHGFCQVYHFGTQDNYNVMVMDLLGPSLEDLFNKCNRRFSLKTVLQIADQMLERADTLHSRHLIHRDIKPANFVIGLGDQGANIFCVDFGLSKRYRHPKNLQHIPHRDGRSLTGTPRYASINNHLGIEQSRRDDLESIGYVLIYFLKGSLPWQGLKAKNAQKKYRLILEKKQQVSIAQLCQGCPSQFAEFLAYTRSLKFDAKPDIPYLRKLFRDLYHAQNCASIPKLWDWDGMETDYNSASGSAGGGAPAIMPATGPSNAMGLRPTTAAAVVSNTGGLQDDILLGGGVQDDLDEDYDLAGGVGGGANMRPNTAGAMLQGYRGGNTGMPTANPQGNSWGYSRQADPVASSDPNQANRRPHTAHGARGPAFPAATQQQYAMDPSKAVYATEGDAHVAAGARDMMRYRRSRGEGDIPGVTPQGIPASSMPLAGAGLQQNYGAAAVNSNWGMYQQKVPAQQMPGTAPNPQLTAQQTQHMSMKKASNGAPVVGGVPAGATGAVSGWPFSSDRPKSANLTMGANVNPAAGGVAGRPQQWNPQPVGAGAVGVPPTAAQQNSGLSYGALKNRFMPGNAAPNALPAGVQAVPQTAVNKAPGALQSQNSQTGLNSNGSNKAPAATASSGKLFSLGR